MTRQEAVDLVSSRISNKNLVKHLLAVEAVMVALAKKGGEDEESWRLAGLLHDLDYSETQSKPERHGLMAAEELSSRGDLSEDVVHAIKAHPGHVERISRMDKALYAVDPLTGLIVAATLMHPSKRLSQVDVPFVMKRFKEKRFAAGADRNQIRSCEETGLELDEFVGIALTAMQSISDELGL